MIRRSWKIQVFSAAFAVFVIVTALAHASESEVSIGMAGRGMGTLGESPFGVNDDLLINYYPYGASLFLLNDEDVTAMDQITITTSGSWKLTVEDVNTGANKGKMRKYNNEGYVIPESCLENNFKLLVHGIGSNGVDGDVFDDLTDAENLAGSVDLIKDDGSFSNKNVDLKYSQMVDDDYDYAGRYRITLQFTLSPQ